MHQFCSCSYTTKSSISCNNVYFGVLILIRTFCQPPCTSSCIAPCDLLFASFIPALLHCIYMCNINPLRAQQTVLNSVPKGSGFLAINDMFGSPPVFVVLGLKANIDSSNTLIHDDIIQVCAVNKTKSNVSFLCHTKNTCTISPF